MQIINHRVNLLVALWSMARKNCCARANTLYIKAGDLIRIAVAGRTANQRRLLAKRVWIPLLILVQLGGVSATVRADETLSVLKVGSEVYTNVTVTAVTPTDIFFTYDRGMANVKLKNLEPALQSHFKYDAAKAKGVEEKQKVVNLQNALPATIDRANAKSVMEDAMARVKAIVNQPVRQLGRASDMNVASYGPAWFHAGAAKPNFNTVDIRATQDLQYGLHPYVTSDLNPGVVFIGSEIEFNPATKYFYTDRTLPKQKLTEAASNN